MRALGVTLAALALTLLAGCPTSGLTMADAVEAVALDGHCEAEVTLDTLVGPVGLLIRGDSAAGVSLEDLDLDGTATALWCYSYPHQECVEGQRPMGAWCCSILYTTEDEVTEDPASEPDG